MSNDMTEFYGEPIYVYTRTQAIQDGVLIDASVGDLATLTREHYKYPVAMTATVWALIEKAVANKKHLNDYKGVWHDVLWMSRKNITQRFDETSHLFGVIITGTGRRRKHTLKVICGPGDNAEPVITIMLPEED